MENQNITRQLISSNHQSSVVIKSTLKKSLNIIKCQENFKRKLKEKLNFIPDLQYLLTVKIPYKTSNNTLINLYELTIELVNDIIKYDQINCLVLDISIVENSIYVSMNHDKKGRNKNDFKLRIKNKKYSIETSSIIKKLDLLDSVITFDIGSTKIISR